MALEKLGKVFKLSSVDEERDVCTQDEETVREVYSMLIKKSALDAFDHIRLAHTETQLLAARPKDFKPAPPPPVKTRKEIEASMYTITEDHKIVQGPVKPTRVQMARDVFQPFYTLPTMTLAEVADIEMAMALTPQVPEPEKDDDVMDEAQEMKDRLWDDWKDMNPRGSGNKMANIG
ncbi:MAG: uncharacterized protein KVP18_003337 [Porospora cf. gigantea A]|nr:MAG: hypothetical protein KVP18_003337 [Porospora cf. gigantea A]